MHEHTRTELLEPVPGERAAVATSDGERLLIVADIHAGLESAWRSEGIEVPSNAEARRDRLADLVQKTNPDRVIIIGDLAHWIGEPKNTELEEIESLLQTVTSEVPVTLVKGNHDGAIEDAVEITVSDPSGVVAGDLGFVHGNSWPSKEVLDSDIICMGHEHPVVRITDEVGGARIEPVWLRGPINWDAFNDTSQSHQSTLIVFPAFNKRVSGTWVNVESQEFLAPFLPSAFANARAYLLDGTNLGEYRDI